MAIANPVLAINNFSTTNATSYDTAAVVLTSGRRYFISLDSRGSATGISTVQHDPTGSPLSFTQVTDGSTAAALTYGSNAYLEVWEVNVTSTTGSAVIRITANGSTNGMGWILWYITGEDDSGTIVQVVTNSGAGTSSSVTMATFAAVDNLTYFGTAGQSTFADKPISPDESRVEIAETECTEQYHHADHRQNPHGSDTSLTASWTGGEDWGAIGIEIKAEVAAGQPTQKRTQGIPTGSGYRDRAGRWN